MKSILVTGGAGYIGSVAVKRLLEEGHKVVVVDNLSKGIRRLVDERAVFYEMDLIDSGKLEGVFEKEAFDVVMHFASYKAVGESMDNAVKYSDNIVGLINVLNSMVKYNVDKIIFSSSAAVYGVPQYSPIDEEHPLEPINYYGFTKIQGEQIIDWYSRIHGIKYTILRYFNVIGDGGLDYVDPCSSNILPIIMEVIFGERDKFKIYGDDYDTRDGTCVRDYLDVDDLVRAHILALEVKGNDVINLGTSEGVSVKEFVDRIKRIEGVEFCVEYVGQRKGDSASLVTSNERAFEVLGWKPSGSFNKALLGTYEVYLKKFNEGKF